MTVPPYQDITPAQLDALGPQVRRIDVREADEYTGPLGHLHGAELVPLGTLEAASASWPREEPLLLICRSGGRSAKAAQALAQPMPFEPPVTSARFPLSFRSIRFLSSIERCRTLPPTTA